MHRLTAMILGVSNVFQNKNVTIHKIVCVSSPPYYLDWFEISCPNVPINQDGGTFFIQCMNLMRGTKPAIRQWNVLLDDVVKILKYKKITIDHSIYIRFFSDITVSYLIVSTNDVLNNTNNETTFPKLRRFFEEYFDIKVQEGSVFKYPNFQIYQSTIGFSVYQIYHIMELVNEWSPSGKCINFDTYFRTESTYEKELMAALTLTGHALHKSEM